MTSSSLEAGSGFVVISGSPSVAGGGSSGGVVAAGGSSEGVVTAGGSSEGVEPEWWVTSSAEVGTGLDNTGRGRCHLGRLSDVKKVGGLRRTKSGLLLEGREEVLFITILLLTVDGVVTVGSGAQI